MGKIIVISNEPALAQALADELPEYPIVSLSGDGEDAADMAEVVLVVRDAASDKDIAFDEKGLPALMVTRPVRLGELLYTIRARLQAQSQGTQEEILVSDRCVYLPREKMLMEKDGGQTVTLTEKEGELLLSLLNSKQSISREEVLREVWGYNEQVDTHTLETHIYRLRGKLKQVLKECDIIATGDGYRLNILD